MTDTRYPVDHEVREMALEPGRSFIVQAPAGSGKTDLLIKRFLRLLAIVDRPEEILAITFTRKAAAEMRQRVLAALRRADEPAASENEQRLRELAKAARDRDTARRWQLQQYPARLRIQTIDAFNAELTRQLPLLAKFGAQPQISETPTELYEEAVRKTLEALEASEKGWSISIEALLNHIDNDWHKAHGLLMAMLPKREQWLSQIQAWKDRDYAQQALANEISHQLEQLRASIPAELQDEIIALANYAADNVTGGESVISHCRDWQGLPGTTPDDLPQWRGLAEVLLTGTGDWRKKPNKNQGFPATARPEKARIEQLLLDLAGFDEFQKRLHAVRQLPDPVYDERQWQLLKVLVELLPLAVAQLKVVFAGQGQVDFAEMAERALQALGSDEAPTDLGLRLDYRIQHILVDEFQDTSVIQHRLLQRLTAGWQPDDGRTLFLVGDPMQSIYRFREAEVGLFLETWRHGLGDISLQPLRLQVNFRSQAGIVDWVNHCFRQVLPAQPDSASGAVPYAAAEAWHAADGEPAVSVHPQFGLDSAAEAQQILELIEQERADNSTTAVLVQTRNHLAALVPLLRRRGLRYRAMEIERLGRQPVVQDLLALTRALLHPADRIAWLSVLRAPWCGLTRHDLHALASSQPTATGPELINSDECSLSESGRERLAQVSTVLNKVLAERRRRMLRDSVESAWLGLGGPCCVTATAALDDAAAFFNLLERIDEAGDLSSAGSLMRELEQLFAPPDPDAGEALQIMTIHKAKGLEFDCVILPGLGRPPRHDDEQLVLWQTRQRETTTDLLIAPLTAAGADRDPVYAFLRELEKERGQYERGRLLYVACTRAQRRLHLLGHVNVKEERDGSLQMKAPQANSALSLLWPQVAGEFEGAFDTYQPEAVETEQESVSVFTPRRLPADWSLPSLPESVTPQAALAAAGEEAGPIEFSWAGESARIAGVVVHRLLQRIGRDGASAWSPARIEQLNEFINSMLRQQGLPAEHRDAAGKQVRAALANVLADDRGRWILDNTHQETATELALSRVANGRLESVVLDRTFVDADGTRWIIDYKTGSHAGSDREVFLDQEQERYREQLERYAAFMSALEQRPIKLGLYFPLMNGWREWGVNG